MKPASLLPVAFAVLALATAPLAFAQAPDRGSPGDRGSRPAFPTLPPQAAAPPRPAGLGGNLPPGFGGPNPGDGRRGNGDASAGRSELRGLLSACAPGGALSGDAEDGQVGRNRARALVCPPN
jgi:hypothetical protein